LAGKVGKDTYLENNVSVVRTVQEIKEEFDIYFEWDRNEMGSPGAFYVTNQMDEEFFLVSLTLEYPSQHDNHTNIYFDCNSWVHNRSCYKTDRIFFANVVSEIMIIVVSILTLVENFIHMLRKKYVLQPYLPGTTPVQLQTYREAELSNLRGDGTGLRQKWDRIYDYDVYNDLGFLASDAPTDHPVLGGLNYPYPRRVRTGRQLIQNNKNGEFELHGLKK